MGDWTIHRAASGMAAKQPLDPVRARILSGAQKKGVSLSALSVEIGRNVSYLHQFIHKGSPRKLDEDDRRKIAALLELDEGLLGSATRVGTKTTAQAPATPGPQPIGVLPVRYKVAASHWLEVDDLHDEPLGWAPITPRADIPLPEQWAEQIDGDSCDLLYPDASYIHVRSAWALDAAAAHGKKVVVQRSRNGGLLVERTVKQIEVVMKGGVVERIDLVPKSSNPKWKRFTLTDGLNAGEGEDQVTVEIVALVIGSYRPE